jgi:hypothetical protein
LSRLLSITAKTKDGDDLIDSPEQLNGDVVMVYQVGDKSKYLKIGALEKLDVLCGS